MDALDLAIANVQSSIPDVSAFVTSLQVRALIDTSLSDYYNKQAIDGKLADYYTKTEIGNDFFTKQQTNNLLNTTLQNYYNKTETNAQIDSKLTDYYTKSQVYSKTETDTKLADYYTKTETYNKQEVDNLITQPPDLSLYAKKNDSTQTITAAKVIAAVFQSSANANNALYFENKNAYFTFPLQVTDSSKTGLKTYSYLDGGNTGHGYLGIWRDDYYPHLTMSKTLTTFNKPGAFSGVVTFNNDVTFNDVVVLTSTIALGTKVIDTVVRSNDDITPSDTNIPSTLWAQNKFNTKVDNGTVYTKVELNNLLMLTNLYVIQLLVDVLPPQIVDNTTSTRYFISGAANDDDSIRLYFSNSSVTINFSGYGLFIRNGRLYFTQNQIVLQQGDLYTIQLPSAIKVIKITRTSLSDAFSYYTHPFILGNPIQLPQVININPLPYLNFLSLTLQFKYTRNSTQQTKTYNFDYSDVEVYIAHMNGNININYLPDTGAGFFFICHGRYVENNIIYTTLRCLYLTNFKSYSFTSNTGSIFYIPNLDYNFEPDFGFNFQLNINTPSNGSPWYIHNFTTNLISPRDKDTNNLIVYGDFALPCGMFYDKITCL